MKYPQMNLKGDVLKMLSRLELLIGKNNIQTLKSSFAVVCGLGGVGGHCVEALARCGIGKIRIVDADCFEKSNINRQLFSDSHNIGKPKTEEVKKRLIEINPDIEIEELCLFADENNIDLVLKGNPDIVIDAIDSLSSKCMLLCECIKRNIKVVSSMGAALKTDPLKIKTADISETHTCPLAKAVRKELEKHNVKNGIRCVFSTEKSAKKENGILGSYEPVTGTFGLFLAHIAISQLLKF